MIQSKIAESIAVKKLVLNDKVLIDKIQKAADIIINSLLNEGQILFCGNGGSAADAQHLAAELSGRFYFDRPPLNAEALHVNTSFLTAVANDYSYDQIYARAIKGKGKKGDVLIGISTSGNSNNIVNAYKIANEIGMQVISMTGETGGLMKEDSNLLLNVPSTDTPRIQECHILIGHIICEIVEQSIFPQS